MKLTVYSTWFLLATFLIILIQKISITSSTSIHTSTIECNLNRKQKELFITTKLNAECSPKILTLNSTRSLLKYCSQHAAAESIRSLIAKDIYFKTTQNEIFIDSQLFDKNSVKNLINFTWSWSNINKVTDFTFFNMIELEKINLNNNWLRFITSECFKINTINNKLEQIDLSNNPIEWIDKSSFETLRNLKILNLSQTNLIEIDSSLFSKTYSLKHLDLSHLQHLCQFEWSTVLAKNLSSLSVINFSYLKNENILFDYEQSEQLYDILKKLKFLKLKGLTLNSTRRKFLNDLADISNSSIFIEFDSSETKSGRVSFTKRDSFVIDLFDEKSLVKQEDNEILSIDENNSTDSTSSNCSKIDQSNKTNSSHFSLDPYTVIAICFVSLVLIMAMITGIIVYKMRTKYLLKRQINQFKRIDAQLGLDKIYNVSYDNAFTS